MKRSKIPYIGPKLGDALRATALALWTVVLTAILFLLWLVLYPFGLSRLIAKLQYRIYKKEKR